MSCSPFRYFPIRHNSPPFLAVDIVCFLLYITWCIFPARAEELVTVGFPCEFLRFLAPPKRTGSKISVRESFHTHLLNRFSIQNPLTTKPSGMLKTHHPKSNPNLNNPPRISPVQTHAFFHPQLLNPPIPLPISRTPPLFPLPVSKTLPTRPPRSLQNSATLPSPPPLSPLARYLNN